HHAAVRMPDGTETLPVAGIAPDNPVLQQLPDEAVVFKLGLASRHLLAFLPDLNQTAGATCQDAAQLRRNTLNWNDCTAPHGVVWPCRWWSTSSNAGPMVLLKLLGS